MAKQSAAQTRANPMRKLQRVDKGHRSWRVVMRRMHQHLRQHFTDSVYGSKDLTLAAAVARQLQSTATASVTTTAIPVTG